MDKRQQRKPYAYSAVLIFSFIAILLNAGICPAYSEVACNNIPNGYHKEIRGKYRVIECNDETGVRAHVLMYDANRIQNTGSGVKIFPPAYAQEHFMGVWYEEAYNEVFDTIYQKPNVIVIENRNPFKKTSYPPTRRPIKPEMREPNPFGIFKNTLIAADKLLSHRMFVDVTRSSNPQYKQALKIITTSYFQNLPRSEKVSVMQSIWKLWAGVKEGGLGVKAIMAFVDAKNNLIGYANGDTEDSIVFP